MKLLLTTAAVLIAATGATAQGLSGATVGLEYTTFPDVDDESSTRIFGSVEFEVVQGVSIAADLSNRNYDNFDEDASNIVLHGIYAISPDVAVGAFVGRETIDQDEIDNYGAEAAYMSGPVMVEGYFGVGDLEDADLTFVGAIGGYDIGNGIDITAGLERIGFDTGFNEGSFTSLEIGGAFAFSGGGEIYVKAGQLSIDDGSTTSEENFFELGLSYSFGPKGGTTFSPRGLLEVVPVGEL